MLKLVLLYYFWPRLSHIARHAPSAETKINSKSLHFIYSLISATCLLDMSKLINHCKNTKL